MTKDSEVCEISRWLSKFNTCFYRLKLKSSFLKSFLRDQSNCVFESFQTTIRYIFKFDVKNVCRFDRRKHFYWFRSRKFNVVLKKVLFKRLNITLSTFASKISSHHHHLIFVFVHTRCQFMQCQTSFCQSFTTNQWNHFQQNLSFSISSSRQFLTYQFLSKFSFRSFFVVGAKMRKMIHCQSC